MTDPAIEAAQRALVATRGHGNSTVCEIAAAREMAKSVQELHRRRASGAGLGYRAYCDECGYLWPCETAKRVYPSEELEG